MTTVSSVGVERMPELVWIGNGAWVACDPAVAESDPRRVLAYLECRDHIVYVLWVKSRTDVVEYASIREALQDISGSLVPSV